jgi:hypothetical protein
MSNVIQMFEVIAILLCNNLIIRRFVTLHEQLRVSVYTNNSG